MIANRIWPTISSYSPHIWSKVSLERENYLKAHTGTGWSPSHSFLFVTGFEPVIFWRGEDMGVNWTASSLTISHTIDFTHWYCREIIVVTAQNQQSYMGDVWYACACDREVWYISRDQFSLSMQFVIEIHCYCSHYAVGFIKKKIEHKTTFRCCC